MTSNDNRRRLMRINLDAPIQAKVASSLVTLRDISATGARFDHSFPLSRGRDIVLEFVVGDEQVTITCEVTRCKLERVGADASYSSGVRFQDSGDGAIGSLKRIIADAVGRDFEARKQHMLKIKK